MWSIVWFAAASHAQAVGGAGASPDAAGQPAEATAPDDAPRVDDAASPSKTAPAPPAAPRTPEAVAIGELRRIEGRLSVGEPLDGRDRNLLVDIATRGPTPRARALATAVLPWLPPHVAIDPLLQAAGDDDPRVRAQGAQSLAALSRRLSDDDAVRVRDVALVALDDKDDEVACAAGRLVSAVAPDDAVRAFAARAETATDVRYGCWRRIASLPMRPVEVAPPTPPDDFESPAAEDDDDDDDEPDEMSETPAFDAPDEVTRTPGTGDGLFIVAAAATGGIAAALIPTSLLTPRDTLTYSRSRTTHSREEPSILLSVGSAIAGATLMGGAAAGVDYLVGPVDFAPATSTAAMAGGGAAFGLGLNLALGLDESLSGFSFAGTSMAGLLLGGTMSLVLPPSAKDMTLLGSVTLLTTFYGVLITLTVVPVGVPLVLDRVHRTDFAIGVGLMSGSVAALSALVASPLLDISHGRVMAATAASALASASALTLAYLVIPTALTIRPRIAAGVGVAAGLLVGPAVFALLPDSWARVMDAERVPPALGALVLDEGVLKMGMPSVMVLEGQLTPRGAQPALGMSLFGGRF